MGQVFSSFIENCSCGSAANSNDELIRQQEIIKIRQDISNIKDNHLYHIEKDMLEIKMDIKIILMKLK